MAAQQAHVCKLATLALEFIPLIKHCNLVRYPAPLLPLLCFTMDCNICLMFLNLFNLTSKKPLLRYGIKKIR